MLRVTSEGHFTTEIAGPTDPVLDAELERLRGFVRALNRANTSMFGHPKFAAAA
jgi:hypothetical protein